jgi:hypothetical protein
MMVGNHDTGTNSQNNSTEISKEKAGLNRAAAVLLPHIKTIPAQSSERQSI